MIEGKIAPFAFILFFSFPARSSTDACRPAKLTKDAVLVERAEVTLTRKDRQERLTVSGRTILGRWRWTSNCRKRLESALKLAVSAALEDRGYWKGVVSVELVRVGASVTARARVVAGTQWRVGALDVAGVSYHIRLLLLARVKLRSGRVLLGRTMRRDAEAISDYYKERGHPFAQTEVATRRHGNGRLIDVVFSPRPGEYAKVKGVEVKGGSPTGAMLLRRGLLPLEKAPYNGAKLGKAVARLMATGAFESILVRSRKVAPGWVMLSVRVRERPLP